MVMEGCVKWDVQGTTMSLHGYGESDTPLPHFAGLMHGVITPGYVLVSTQSFFDYGEQRELEQSHACNKE